MKSSRCPPADEWITSKELSLFSVAVRKHWPGVAWGGNDLFQLAVQGKNSKEPRGGEKNQNIPFLLLWSQRKAPVKVSSWMEPHCNCN